MPAKVSLVSPCWLKMGDIVAVALLRNDELQVEFVSINFQFAICLLYSVCGRAQRQSIAEIAPTWLPAGGKIRSRLSQQAAKPSKTGPKQIITQRFALAAIDCSPAANCARDLEN